MVMDIKGPVVGKWMGTGVGEEGRLQWNRELLSTGNEKQEGALIPSPVMRPCTGGLGRGNLV